MNTLRNSRGQFIRGSKFWLGKKRLDMIGNKWNIGRKPWNWNPIEKTCKMCGKKYFVKKSKLHTSKFCSCFCKNKFFFTGDRNPNWKNGITKDRDRLRTSEEYVKWRLKVYQRDWFACRWCGHIGRKSKAHGDKTSDIHAHHIESIEDNPKLCLKEGNGITLCIKCHRLTYGKEKEFAKAFKEILRDYTPKIRKD